MRDLVIQSLTESIEYSNGEGIPRYYDCDEDEYIKDTKELNSLSDEKLLSIYTDLCGFQW